MFKHYSLSSMGSDLGDVNNDGKFDLFISEMQPYYNKRKKLFQKGTSYTKDSKRILDYFSGAEILLFLVQVGRQRFS